MSNSAWLALYDRTVDARERWLAAESRLGLDPTSPRLQRTERRRRAVLDDLQEQLADAYDEDRRAA